MTLKSSGNVANAVSESDIAKELTEQNSLQTGDDFSTSNGGVPGIKKPVELHFEVPLKKKSHESNQGNNNP